MEPKTTTNETTRKKCAASIVRFVVSLLLFALAFTVFFTVINAKRKNETPTFFGHSFYIVITGSMEPDIHVGELLIVRKTPMEEIKVGDDILFVSLSGQVQGENIVHRVIDIGEDGRGLYFRTKGTGNAIEDSDKVRADNFVGKAIAHSAFLGKFFRFISNIEVLLMIAVVAIVVPMVIGQTIKSLRQKEDGDEQKEPPKE